MDRKRKYCPGARNCYFEDDTTYKTNVTISQPKDAPKNFNREKALSARYTKQATASVINSLFSSGGYGSPDSHNRKQDTLAFRDKKELSQVNPSWRPDMAFSNGYITKSQSKLESNVGSMDRLARLKAKAVALSKDE